LTDIATGKNYIIICKMDCQQKTYNVTNDEAMKPYLLKKYFENSPGSNAIREFCCETPRFYKLFALVAGES